MKTERVEVEGSRVSIEAGNEALARSIGAAADREVLLATGSRSQKFDSWQDDVGRWVETLNRPAMGMFGIVLAIVAGVMAYMSFERLQPSVGVLFGIVGVIAVLVTKTAFSRWAKADNMGSAKLSNQYRTIACAGLALILGVGIAYQMAVNRDVEQGLTAVESKVEKEDRAIATAEFDASQMERPTDTSEILMLDLNRRLAAPARNKDGKPAGFTIGEAVGAGQRGADGKLAATFCMPNDAKAYYVNGLCEALIDMELGIQRRLNYESALADIARRKTDNDAARVNLPKKGSSVIMGEETAAANGQKGGGEIWAIVIGSLILLVVELGMGFCTYISKRHPKGVTEALAQLVEEKAAEGRPS